MAKLSLPPASVTLRQHVTLGNPGVGRLARTAATDQRVSFESSVTTDIVLRELHSVSFEDYMCNEDRVFAALFPDQRRRERLNEHDWRIHMLPIEFFFLSAKPVIDMRVTFEEPNRRGLNTQRVKKLLTLKCTRWELQGLGYKLKPSEFDLSIDGILYPERASGSARLKGQMKLSVDLTIPPALSLVSPEVMKPVGSTLLAHLLQPMQDRVNTKLLTDYRAYALQQHATTFSSA